MIYSENGYVKMRGDGADLTSDVAVILTAVFNEVKQQERGDERLALALMVNMVKGTIERNKIPARMILDAIRDIEEVVE